VRLIDELGEATERAYRLSIPANKADLREASRIRRARLEGWIAEQVHALPEKSRPGASARLRAEVEAAGIGRTVRSGGRRACLRRTKRGVAASEGAGPSRSPARFRAP